MVFNFATNNDDFYERSGFLKTVLGHICYLHYFINRRMKDNYLNVTFAGPLRKAVSSCNYVSNLFIIPMIIEVL